MDPLAAHRSALRQFDDRVQIIRDDQWNNATPDKEWDVTALVRHLVYEQLWVPELLAGRTIADIYGAFSCDLLCSDPQAAQTAVAVAAQAAFTQSGALDTQVHLFFCDVSASVYLWEMIVDLVVHAWDLAEGIRASDHMPNDLISAALDRAKPMAANFAGSDLFGPPIPVPGCTDDLTELLAVLGRRRYWSVSR